MNGEKNPHRYKLRVEGIDERRGTRRSKSERHAKAEAQGSRWLDGGRCAERRSAHLVLFDLVVRVQQVEDFEDQGRVATANPQLSLQPGIERECVGEPRQPSWKRRNEFDALL